MSKSGVCMYGRHDQGILGRSCDKTNGGNLKSRLVRARPAPTAARLVQALDGGVSWIALATKEIFNQQRRGVARLREKKWETAEQRMVTHQSASALSADAGLVFPNIRPGMRYEPAMAGR